MHRVGRSRCALFFALAGTLGACWAPPAPPEEAASQDVSGSRSQVEGDADTTGLVLPVSDASTADDPDTTEDIHGVTKPDAPGPLGDDVGSDGLVGAGTDATDTTVGAEDVPCFPSDEECNGLDDDCDDNIDEGLDVPLTCGLGVCAVTKPACFGGVPQTCEQNLGLATDEICDGLDNDCDGQADEDGDGEPLTEPCYTGPAGTNGVATCAAGLTTCTSGEFGACTGEITPADESCDGIDNDCDDHIDEDLGEVACGLGGCLKSIPACVGGVIQVCDPLGEAQVELCNGLDDDCDGQTDEDFDLGGECEVGMGSCARLGAFVCGDNGAAGCDAEPGEPIDELCDAVDNDCDGVTDEDFVALGLGEPCDGDDDDSCQDGVLSCPLDGLDLTCTDDDAAYSETCDAVDNDCDEEVDEDFDLQTDLSHCGVCEHDCAVAGAGTGVETWSCEAGTCVVDTCNAGQLDIDSDEPGCEYPCTPNEATGGEETCNGSDDDCDGDTDEGELCESAGPASHATCLDGLCAEATCAQGTWDLDGLASSGCEYVCAKVSEVDSTCDGVDDDCDGETDEDYEAQEITCGKGACEQTVQTTCEAGNVLESCVEAIADADVDANCDGVDEDCDGLTDEDYVGVETSCGLGACASTGTSICVEGGVQSNCAEGIPMGDDITCDGVDDDCDDQIDESAACDGHCLGPMPWAEDESTAALGCHELVDSDFETLAATTCDMTEAGGVYTAGRCPTELQDELWAGTALLAGCQVEANKAYTWYYTVPSSLTDIYALVDPDLADIEAHCIKEGQDVVIQCPNTSGCPDGAGPDDDCAAVQICADGDVLPCTQLACKANTAQDNVCVYPAPNHDACDDGVSCTEDMCDAELELCTNEPTHALCDDGDTCTVETCVPNEDEPEASCVVTPVDGTPDCDDGRPCTDNDACDDGVCVGVDKVCLGPPGQPCMTGLCVDGDCLHTAVGPATTCDDSDACTEDDGCVVGVCVGVASSCDDGDPATFDSCSDGACTSVDCLDDTHCDDRTPCTTDVCEDDGTCSHTAVDSPGCDFGDGYACCYPNVQAAGCEILAAESCTCAQPQGATCCSVAWDETCVTIAESACGLTCLDTTCGDGECQDTENASSCPDDCAVSGDPCCEESEFPNCGNTTIEACVCAMDAFCCDEDPNLDDGRWDGTCVWTAQNNCGLACPPTCGNGECEDGEDSSWCPDDCPAGGGSTCGDDYCAGGEEWICPFDCNVVGCNFSGPGDCQNWEDLALCPDCWFDPTTCGNGLCDGAWDAYWGCASECTDPPSSTPCYFDQDCEDAFACTADTCEFEDDEQTALVCRNTSTESPCDDGNICTDDDACDGTTNECVGTPNTSGACSECPDMSLEPSFSASSTVRAIDMGMVMDDTTGFVFTLSDQGLESYFMGVNPVPGEDVQISQFQYPPYELTSQATDLDVAQVDEKLFAYVVGPDLGMQRFLVQAGAPDPLGSHETSGCKAISVRPYDGVIALGCTDRAELIVPPYLVGGQNANTPAPGGQAFEKSATLETFNDGVVGDDGSPPDNAIIDVSIAQNILLVLDAHRGIHAHTLVNKLGKPEGAEELIDEPNAETKAADGPEEEQLVPEYAATLTVPNSDAYTYRFMATSQKHAWVAVQHKTDLTYELHAFEPGGIDKPPVPIEGKYTFQDGVAVEGLVSGPCDAVTFIAKGEVGIVRPENLFDPNVALSPPAPIGFEAAGPIASLTECGYDPPTAGWLAIGGARGGVGLFTTDESDNAGEPSLEHLFVRTGASQHVAIASGLAFVGDGDGILQQYSYSPAATLFSAELYILDPTAEPPRVLETCNLEGPVVGLDVGPVGGLVTDDERHTYAATRSRVSGEPGTLQAFMPGDMGCCTDCRVYLEDADGGAMNPEALVVNKEEIYVTGDDGEGAALLLAFDAGSNPVQPSLVASVKPDGVATLGPAVVRAGWLYSAGTVAATGDAVLMGFELSALASSTPVMVPVALLVQGDHQTTVAMHDSTTHLYALVGPAEDSDGASKTYLRIVDITDPANPTLAGDPIDTAGFGQGIGNPQGLQVVSTFLFLTDPAAGLTALSITVPDQPMPLSHQTLEGQPTGLVSRDSTLYVASGDALLNAVEISCGE